MCSFANEARNGAGQLEAALRAANPDYTRKGRFLLAEGKVMRVGLQERQITDLSPLAGLQLVELFCGGNAITDLSALTGIRQLLCQSNRITDAKARQEEKMAERQGFEPWVPRKRDTAFPVLHIRPLCHLSAVMRDG